MKFNEPIVHALSIQEKCSALLNEHHVDGLFYHFYKREEGLSHYKKQWIHNQVIIEELDSLNTLAKKFKTKATILKGAHLLFDLYSDLGSRFMSDIDLLISSHDIKQWESVLTELGCVPISQKTFHGNNFKQEWCKKIGDIEINIEVHTKLFFHLKHEDWQLSPTHFSNLYKLNNEDLFIHLCGHLAFQHTFLKLYWLFDIYFFLQKYSKDLDWKIIKDRSQKLELYRSIQMCLWLLKNYFGLFIDNNIIDFFEINKKQWWKKFLTIDFLIDPLSQRMSYLVVKHATKDRLVSALRYDLSWFYHYKIHRVLLKK